MTYKEFLKSVSHLVFTPLSVYTNGKEDNCNLYQTIQLQLEIMSPQQSHFAAEAAWDLRDLHDCSECTDIRCNNAGKK